jgi:hypothetical protein
MEIMEKYADALYDSSGDYWKLTANGGLINDGHARVVDENGKVLISLRDLGMSDDSDTIGALARMFGISEEKAAEINRANNGSIQLGYGAGIGGNDYVNALTYALSGMTVNGRSDAIFNGMTTDERAEYLKRQVIIGSAFIGNDKGAVAANLRNLKGLHNENILNELFYTSTPSNSNNYYENAATYDFMNEPLREFLNLNFNGSSEYNGINNVLTQGFSEMDYWGSLYHLDPNYSDVKKYTHTDGREVIFGINKQTNKYEQINNELYGGTFNYAGGLAHFDFDMRTFDNKYGTSIPASFVNGITYGVTDNAYKIGKSLSNEFSNTLRQWDTYNTLNSPEKLLRNMYRYMERER